MKPNYRILWTVPFILVSVLYYKFSDPDDTCSGIIHTLVDAAMVIAFIVTGGLAIFGVAKAGKTKTIPFDVLFFTIITLCFLSLIYTKTFRGHTTGTQYLYARQIKPFTTQFEFYDLSLRTNNTFTFTIHTIDGACAKSGKFKIKGDTIVFDRTFMKGPAGAFTNLLKLDSDRIVPIGGNNPGWALDVVKPQDSSQ